MFRNISLFALVTVMLVFSIAFGQSGKNSPAEGETLYSLKVLSPNGGEQWVEGTTQVIKWETVSPMIPDSLEIRLIPKANESAAKSVLLVKMVKDAPNMWEWVKAGPQGNNFKIEVAAYFPGKVKVKVVKDLSDKVFNIVSAGTAPGGDIGGHAEVSLPAAASTPVPQSALKVLSPNGGEKIRAGSVHKITWAYRVAQTADKQASPDMPESTIHFTISLSRDGGETYPETIGTNISSINREFDWTVDGLFSDKCRVKVVLLTNQGNRVFDDISDGNFQIVSVTEKPQGESPQH